MKTIWLKDLPCPAKNKKGWPWTKVIKPLAKTKFWPKVSLVIPVLNQAPFVEESIRSILLQGYPNLELVVMDGGSKDGTVKIIKKYKRFLKYWESKKDKGQSHAINKGFKKCDGKYINWHNADDVFLPGAVATSVKAFLKHPSSSYVHGFRKIVDRNLWFQYDTQKVYGKKSGYLPTLERALKELKAGTQPGCLMNRSLVAKAGGVDERLVYTMDPDLLLRLLLIKPAFYIPKALVSLRVYPGIKSLQWNETRAKEKLYLAEKIYSKFALAKKLQKIKPASFHTAYQFARRCYTKTARWDKALISFIMEICYGQFKK